LVTPIVANMSTARQLATTDYIIFRVQPNLDVGYSFEVANPPSPDNPILIVQFFGFIMVISGLVWESRHFIWKQLKQVANKSGQKQPATEQMNQTEDRERVKDAGER
jgi:hypothetical protein